VQWSIKTCATNNKVQRTEGHQFHLDFKTYWCCLIPTNGHVSINCKVQWPTFFAQNSWQIWTVRLSR